ncbi:GNAT family N-acetyltransferase [Rubrolithibacter danxiaensis]|uniref:GNAT family N-acetyltransferase n=1 Tax=Rubrolithibacter danxiaensis TaxID=3390805 RepID=UPI003BF847A0
MELIELTINDQEKYKRFFIRGLLEHKDNFRMSANDEEQEAFPTKGTSDSFTLACVTAEGELAGVVSFEREGAKREKLRHKGLLFRMYVSADFAGQGIGKRLVQETIERAKKTDIEQVNLTVVSSNTIAKNLYHKFNFKTFSVEERAMKDGNKYLTEEQMVLFIK